MKALLGCAVLGLTLLTGAACGDSAPACRAAGTKLLGTIASGSKMDGLTLTSGSTLESPDHKGTYVVAAKAKVKNGPERVGVWTTSNLQGEGAVYAVDSVAQQLTSFGESSQVDSGVTTADKVVGQVRGCL